MVPIEISKPHSDSTIPIWPNGGAAGLFCAVLAQSVSAKGDPDIQYRLIQFCRSQDNEGGIEYDRYASILASSAMFSSSRRPMPLRP